MSRPQNPASLKIHFVGVGGIGMSGLAELFFREGYAVSGSDLSASETTAHLAKLGVTIFKGHAAENIAGAHVVVTSSAVRSTNPEVLEARKRRIPVIPRAEMLGELMRGKVGVAVAGTHGKTTTTSMLGSIVASAGWDPTLVIGGKVDTLGGNAKLGQGRFVVAEADESDGSFLHLPATYAIITTIDDDHLDHYGSMAAIEDAFVALVAKLPFYGRAAVCGDDPGVKRVLERFGKPYITYGFDSSNDVRALDVEADATGCRYRLEFGGKVLGKISLHQFGRHNVLNSLAAATLALELGLTFEEIAAGLLSFKGVRRRFELKWKSSDGKRLILEDYGHHPTEIKATLEAVRQYWSGRVITVFQPHRYTRTQQCWDSFLTAFDQANALHLLDIYSAGEEPLAGITSDALTRAIVAVHHGRSAGLKQIEYTPEGEVLLKALHSQFRDGDLILFLGAGSIHALAEQFAESLTTPGD